jgi:formiminotetrahydrofolate cyclodeaminase
MMPALQDLRIGDFLTALASGSPTPGGGTAAALVGSLASALGSMVAAVAQAKEASPGTGSLLAEFRSLGDQLIALADLDERAFSDVMQALRTPKTDPKRHRRVLAALERAADVALTAGETSVEVIHALVRAEAHASLSIASDIGVAAHLASAAARSSLLTVRANLRFMAESPTRARVAEACDRLDSEVQAISSDLVGRVARRLAPPET